MKAVIRTIGNSQGVLLPKPLLAQAGLTDAVEMAVENGAIVLRAPRDTPRAGWAEAAAAMANQEDDALVWPEFANEDDVDLRW